MVSEARFSKPMLTLTAVVAMIYGLSFVIFDLTAGSVLFWVGAVIVGALFVAFLVIPFLRGLVALLRR